MKIFKTNKRQRLINELRNWSWTFVSSALVVFLIFIFLSLTPKNIWILVLVTFLVKFCDTLFQYHVDEIRIDDHTDKLIIGLSSLLSGKQEKIFDLNQVQVRISKNSKLDRWLIGPITLNILLPKKKVFKISGRYGFSADSLNEIESVIKSTAFIDNLI